MKKKEERLEKVLAETQAENKRLQEPLQRVGPLASLVNCPITYIYVVNVNAYTYMNCIGDIIICEAYTPSRL